jgi:phosphoribosylglycinamide formyltransferase-1
MRSPLRICLFASGSGSNVENIVNYFKNNEKIVVDSVICNRKNAYVFERAERLNVPAFYCSKSEFEASNMLVSFLQERNVDCIVLAGFLLKVPEKLISAFPNNILNIHPALLPKFGGKGMYGMNVHKAVVEAKEEETGITIHLVNENYDEGKIIFQAKTPVKETDTPENVAENIHKLEYEHFPKVIEEFLLSNF